jgi:alpha-L-rhamnosidase
VSRMNRFMAASAIVATAATVPAVTAAAAIPDWPRYVLGPATPYVTPVRVVSTSGAVTNPQGLVDPSRGPATLTSTLGGAAPVVVLDYGQDVGGLPYFQVSAASGIPTLRAAYSEAEQFAGPDGDGTSCRIWARTRPGTTTTSCSPRARSTSRWCKEVNGSST